MGKSSASRNPSVFVLAIVLQLEKQYQSIPPSSPFRVSARRMRGRSKRGRMNAVGGEEGTAFSLLLLFGPDELLLAPKAEVQAARLPVWARGLRAKAERKRKKKTPRSSFVPAVGWVTEQPPTTLRSRLEIARLFFFFFVAFYSWAFNRVPRVRRLVGKSLHTYPRRWPFFSNFCNLLAGCWRSESGDLQAGGAARRSRKTAARRASGSLLAIARPKSSVSNRRPSRWVAYAPFLGDSAANYDSYARSLRGGTGTLGMHLSCEP
ncbi:hypothetical protein FN846DRAFT_979162 [Sphaerosporella brunnea]|uniref:Uncharacterized protein n=1 Tax=Sphaerosporella brunnea TaxID=1250544 RepID=A0A5J5EDV3_9PEZI|nr:hypothetical protein FN846DRAFT_979162 [Sphaerosporella brunnea]